MKKLLFFISLFLFFGCSNSSKELTGTEKSTALEKATPTTTEMYNLLKEASYEKTIELIEKDYFQGYTDQIWIDFLKGQDATYGKVINYEMIDSDVSLYEDGTEDATLIFQVERQNATIYERINVIQPEGKGKYKIKGAFFSENKEGISTVGN